MNARPLDVQTLPLQGWQVIEASAGTGKTWTLAALYLRLILGHGRRTRLLPDQILVMTFTEAATAELRERIQRRLEAAARWFEAAAGGSPRHPKRRPTPCSMPWRKTSRAPSGQVAPCSCARLHRPWTWPPLRPSMAGPDARCKPMRWRVAPK